MRPALSPGNTPFTPPMIYITQSTIGRQSAPEGHLQQRPDRIVVEGRPRGLNFRAYWVSRIRVLFHSRIGVLVQLSVQGLPNPPLLSDVDASKSSAT